MFDVKGKVAIVTGSTRGIGRATVGQLARAGARVVVSSRKAEACAATVAELKREGAEAIAVPAHVGRKDDLARLVAGTLEAFGRIDVLVCNASTNPVYGPLAALTDDGYDKVMETNVKGTFWLCNMALPHIAAGGGGSVIIISSIAGLRGNLALGAYGISKAAESALARNLALEWGPQGVRVNAIAPGLVRTDFAKALLADPVRLERARSRTPLRRIGEPDDIAGIVHFLASPAGAYVTGQVIVADGGETIS